MQKNNKKQNVPWAVFFIGLFLIGAALLIFTLSKDGTDVPEVSSSLPSNTATTTPLSTSAVPVIVTTRVTQAETHIVTSYTTAQTTAATTKIPEIPDKMKKYIDYLNQPEAERTDMAAFIKTLPYYIESNLSRYTEYFALNPQITYEDAVTYVNIGLDRAFYTETSPAPNQQSIYILVNKYFYLSQDYVPENLTELSAGVSSRSGVKMTAEAAAAFEVLSQAAASEGYSVLGHSGYRTYNYQKGLYEGYLQNDTQESVDKYSARPGYSEHQTGLAIDVCASGGSFSGFGQTPSYEWVKNNAYKYGFVIHYTSDNEFLTGYQNEEWHLRYIGKDAAKLINESGLSVDEFIIRLG